MKEVIVVFVFIIILAGLYLLAVMPRMLGKPDTIPFRGRMYAHRGLHDNASEAPENSMRAFQRAVEAGYGIELDIQLTKDKVPVVFHDFTLQRVCGVEGKVRDYTYEELQQFPLCKSREHIPKFSEVLALVNGRVPLIVEFKIEWMDLSLCPIADKLLREYQGPYCMESFHPLGVFWYRRHHKNILRGQLSTAFLRDGEYRGPVYFVMQNLLLNFLTKPDFIAYEYKYPNMLSRKICRRLYGNLAAAWTIKSQEQLEAARKNFDFFIFDSFIPEN